MTLETLPAPVSACIQAINAANLPAFLAVFHDDCVVNDIGRTHAGKAAIQAWAQNEIFAVNVRFEVLAVTAVSGETVARVKVDGTFDKTGLPDPLIFRHHFKVKADRIVEWNCNMERP